MGFSVNLIPLVITLPILFVKFWLFEGPQLILKITWLLVRAIADIFSLPIILRTFFAPWKGEYRQGYVGIARGVGIVVRFFMITVTLLVESGVAVSGIILSLAWLGAPIAWTVLFLKTIGVIQFV